ncbi:MAG TPA: NADH-quinone oxidoreductase subunit NuoH [Candidatus Nanopelagicaceae bacterium]|nr:NADH-quinone oxidoreductase subunit NuoH [Candidatus Nanopelagicaceae bacterium]
MSPAATSVLLAVVVTVVKGLLVIIVLLTGFAYLTLIERKVSARIQLRYGPNRVGPFGLIQPAADAVKLLFKEKVAPEGRDRFLYLLAPALAACAALFAFSVIPVNQTICIAGTHGAGPLSASCPGGYPLHWDVANINVGLLFILAITSLGVYSIFLAGWASNSKYSLLGGLRSAAQLISYEMAVSFALIGPVLLAGSLNLETVVNQQHSLWFVFLQPMGFLLYFTGALAETNRLPFDLPEAESELVAGYHTEYSGMRFGLLQMAEFVNVITVCSIATVMFLGGWMGPFFFLPNWLGPLWFGAKVGLLIFVMMWVRWTFPRLRYDRLMQFGWKVLLPLGMANVLLTSVFVALH